MVVETDASDVAVSATLNQNGKPVAFYSRSLSKCEQAHSSVEKEATAIVEAVRKWSHLLTGKRFQIVTDQRSVSFMYDNKNRGKIKNAKILRWQIELSQYQYEIVYRAGKLNAAADTLSRAYCASLSFSTLYEIHAGLCHPGVTRTYHFVKSKNLPFSLEDVRKMISNCRICAEIKPCFFKTPETHLIKATQPMEQCFSTGYTVYPSVYENKFGVYSWTEVYEGYTSSITGISSKTKLINFSSDVPLFHYHDLSLFSSAVTWARLHFSAILRHILQIFAAKVSQNAANLCS